MRSVHRLTKSLLDILSTFPIASFHCGSKFPQIHLLHHCSPFSTPSSVAHGLPCNAQGACSARLRLGYPADHHVSLGVIWIVTQSPPELLGLNQKHVRGCPSVIP